MTPDLYARISAEAKRKGISPTSRIREILIEQYDIEEPAPQIRSPRTRRVSEKTRAALRYLGDLGSIGNNINQATRRLHEAHKTEVVGEQQYREMSSQLEKLKDLLSDIRREMVGAQ